MPKTTKHGIYGTYISFGHDVEGHGKRQFKHGQVTIA